MANKLASLSIVTLMALWGASSAGCAAWPDEQYALMKQVPVDRIAADRQSILKMTRPEGLSTFGDPVNSEIDEDDPMATVTVSGNAFRTHYDLYAFDGKKDRWYTLNLFSYCDCLGFRKFMMLPYVEVFDRHGNLVSGKARSMREQPPGLVDPFHIVASWGGKLPEDGIYFVMVAADNRCIGGSAGTVQGHGAPPLGMKMSAQHHPFGKYTMKFRLK